MAGPAPVAAAAGGAGEAPVAGHHEGAFHTPHWVYIAVFIALAVLTVLELSVNDVVPGKALQVAALVFLMIAKALLVVLYYMHVRFESRVLQWAVFLPFFAAVFFTVIVMI